MEVLPDFSRLSISEQPEVDFSKKPIPRQVAKAHKNAIWRIYNVGDFFVTTSYDKTAKMWKAGEYHLKFWRSLPHSRSVLCAERLSTNRFVTGAWNEQKNQISLWTDQGKKLRDFGVHRYGVYALRKLSENCLASSSCDYPGRRHSGPWKFTIQLRDIEKANVIRVLEGHKGGIPVLENLNQDLFLSASADRTIRVWDKNEGKETMQFQGQFGFYDAKPLDERTIVSGSQYMHGARYQGSLRLVSRWDWREQKPVSHYAGHATTVYCVLPLTKHLFATGSRDRTIRIWDVRKGQSVQTIEGEGYFYSMAKWGSSILCGIGYPRGQRSGRRNFVPISIYDFSDK